MSKCVPVGGAAGHSLRPERTLQTDKLPVPTLVRRDPQPRKRRQNVAVGVSPRDEGAHNVSGSPEGAAVAGADVAPAGLSVSFPIPLPWADAHGYIISLLRSSEA